MTEIAKALCWAAAAILLALANYAGLIADRDATTMFAIVPALWIATGRPRGCSPRKAKA